ncbi:hypothetical protein [Leptolyngbya iicbica]|uniref:Uncharacterized protein n=2 Tax=Cyanophyceae TaxID=3028117 RepID=A0A4Q7E8N5_9CYAN|nr:hypothetical protein [Leptolyngbya sp. LK]RZM79560.1 hypothetical protein DYY88_12640 [Leptolyngbya sp. LK]
MKTSAPYGWLLRITAKALKYFLLSLAGFTIAYFGAISLDLADVTYLLTWLLEHLVPRVLALLMCLGTTAIIVESLRH